MKLLSLRDVRVDLGKKAVLHGVSLDVEAGEFVGLIGPNGAGKSTLLRAALGLAAGTGTIKIGGSDLGALSSHELARRVAYLPQEREIAWPVSVETVVSLGRIARHEPFSTFRSEDRAFVDEAMRHMDVYDIRNQRATDLSGGEKARVLIARALAQDAPLLLADEPTAGLDPRHQIGLMRAFSELAADGHGVLASLHDLGLAARWCTRLVLIHNGNIVDDGPVRDVLTERRMREVYGVHVYTAEVEGGVIVQPINIVSSKTNT